MGSAKREVEALGAAGTHPNIVELVGIVLPSLASEGSVDEESYTPWSPPLQLLLGLSAGSLFGFLQKVEAWENLRRSGRLGLLIHVARALRALYDASFSHLDLKSHNVLVDPDADGGWVAKL